MSDSDSEDIQQEDARSGEFVAQQWVRIAVVSIGGLVLFAVALLQITGLVDLLAPVAETETSQWLVYLVLVAALVGITVWAWKYWTTPEQNGRE